MREIVTPLEAGPACLSRLIGSFSRFRTEQPSAKLTDQPLMYYAPRNIISDDPVVPLQGDFGAL
jgi:hypothetical protein